MCNVVLEIKEDPKSTYFKLKSITMKALFYFVAIFLFASTETIYSQEYHPLLNNSAWLLYDWATGGRPSEERIIELGEDVILGSYTYKKFIDPFPSYDNSASLIHEVYLREDVDQRKVYKIVDGVDLLLYDFNLQNSSTIYQYGNTFTATVDYVSALDGNRKRITLKSIEEYCGEKLTQVWIEGIGSDKHPFYPNYNMNNVCSASGCVSVFTKCSFQNGVHIFGDSDCSSVAELGIAASNIKKSNIAIAPNPFATELCIQSEIAFEKANLKLFSPVGQLVREINNLSGQRIILRRENLSSGLYFLQLFDNGKLIKTSKIWVD